MSAVGDEEERSTEDLLAAYRAMKEGRRPTGTEPEGAAGSESLVDGTDTPPAQSIAASTGYEAASPASPDGTYTSAPDGAGGPPVSSRRGTASVPSYSSNPTHLSNRAAAPGPPVLDEDGPVDSVRFTALPEPASAAVGRGDRSGSSEAAQAQLVRSSRSAPPNYSLVPLAPGSALSDRLARDHHIAVRGSTSGRAAGYGVAGVALLVLVTEQWLLATTGIPTQVLGLPVLVTGVALLLLGAGLVVLFTFIPKRRRIAVRMAADQRQEWQQVQRTAARLDWLWRVGVAGVAAGLLLAAAAYTVWGVAGDGIAGIGLLLALVGVVVAALALARRNLVRRLYVQTLVLARLEEMGRSPAAGDPRIAPVLRALDQLLGALPESAVRSFLSTAEAQDYLEMIDQLDDRPGQGD